MDKDNQALPTSSDSPPEDNAASVDSLEADVTAAPSAESPDVTEESSPSTGVKSATLEDAISAALQPEEEPEPQADASPAEEEAKSEQSDDEPEGKKEEPAQVEKKDDLNLDALSKKTQNRFRELSKENSEFRSTLDELHRYAGGEDGFNNFRELLKLHAEDPAAAVPMLEQVLQDARTRAGLVVQSDDIRRKLDDGLVDEASAVELEKSRKERERVRQREQQVAHERELQAAKQLQDAQVAALNTWEKNVKERNPDYDSVVDRVRDRFIALATQQPPRTPEEAVALSEQALQEVTQWTKRLMPQKKATKVAPQSGSSAKVTAKPRNLEDVINRLLS